MTRHSETHRFSAYQIQEVTGAKRRWIKEICGCYKITEVSMVDNFLTKKYAQAVYTKRCFTINQEKRWSVINCRDFKKILQDYVAILSVFTKVADAVITDIFMEMMLQIF
jgi:hypothetical protein